MLCVADGVGGWAESGIDPAIYSKKLCNLISKFYDKNEELYTISPKKLLVDAVKSNKEIGSCTCCLVTLDEKAKLL